jgi:hypothetical protein
MTQAGQLESFHEFFFHPGLERVPFLCFLVAELDSSSNTGNHFTIGENKASIESKAEASDRE